MNPYSSSTPIHILLPRLNLQRKAEKMRLFGQRYGMTSEKLSYALNKVAQEGIITTEEAAKNLNKAFADFETRVVGINSPMNPPRIFVTGGEWKLKISDTLKNLQDLTIGTPEGEKFKQTSKREHGWYRDAFNFNKKGKKNGKTRS